jgi:O-antigen/teichoic acid export membrane protein
VAAVVALLALWPALRPAGVGALSVRWTTIKTLFTGGTPFVVFGTAMALQPNIDAIFLSKLAPVAVMGWYAVSRRLVGVLLLPAATLNGALYPTLCRLHATDTAGFQRTTNGALRSVSLLVFPVALCCALFPDVGVALFSRDSFRPAEDNLRILALLVALIYFTMPLGICIMAAGRQRAWSAVQCLCVVTSLALDPVLVPVFQRRTGNGGLGLCVAAVVSEAIMIAAGVALTPSGVFDGRLRRVVLLAMVSGAPMVIAAELARPLGSFIAAPLSLLAYAGSLWLTGAIDQHQVAAIRKALARALARVSPGGSRSASL